MIDSEDILQKATDHLRKGELRLASDNLYFLWQHDKSNINVLLLLARVTFASGQHERALSYLAASEALALRSSDGATVRSTIQELRLSFFDSSPILSNKNKPHAMTKSSAYESWVGDKKNHHILPFIEGQKQFIIFYNAHCATTTIENWYFENLGLMSAIMLLSNIKKGRNPSVKSDFNAAMHAFRHDIFIHSTYYKDAQSRYIEHLNGEAGEKWFSFKFTRNPYRRVIGVYLLYMRANNPVYGTTFRRFISAISQENLQTIDLHLHPQEYSFELAGGQSFDAIFKIEDGIEAHLKTILDTTNEAPTKNKINLETRNFTIYSDDDGECLADTNFLNEMYNIKKAPKITRFFDEELLRSVYNLYKNDFQLYGYEFGEL